MSDRLWYMRAGRNVSDSMRNLRLKVFFGSINFFVMTSYVNLASQDANMSSLHLRCKYAVYCGSVWYLTPLFVLFCSERKCFLNLHNTKHAHQFASNYGRNKFPFGHKWKRWQPIDVHLYKKKQTKTKKQINIYDPRHPPWQYLPSQWC